MNKAVVAYVVLLVVLLVLVYFFIRPASKPTTTTVVTTLSNTTTLNATINTTINTTTSIPNLNYSGCIKAGGPYPLANGNFSTGDFTGWNTTNDGFLVRNLSAMNANMSYYDAPWNGTNATYFASTYDIGTVVRNGNLTSDPFQVVEPYLNFQVITPQTALIYFELMKSNTVILKTYLNSFAVPNNTHAESHFENASITLIPYLCQTLKIRVVAAVTGNRNNIKQFVAATNFYLSKQPNASPDIFVNQTT